LDKNGGEERSDSHEKTMRRGWREREKMRRMTAATEQEGKKFTVEKSIRQRLDREN
jgi:hypothetical protein